MFDEHAESLEIRTISRMWTQASTTSTSGCVLRLNARTVLKGAGPDRGTDVVHKSAF